MAEKRLPKSWARYLADDDNPVTLAEFHAACASLELGHAMAARQAAEHTESMIGAMDQLVAALAQRMGLPYAGDGEVRAALDERRDEQRRLAAKARPDG